MSNNNQENLSIPELTQKYIQEFYVDSNIDPLRIREVMLKMLSIKGKWASYKAVHRMKLNQLKSEQKRLIYEGVELIKNKRESEGNPVSSKGAGEILKNKKKYRELDEKIDNLNDLCIFFDDCLKSIMYDKNIQSWVETTKLEEL
jgi:hypothetical protein